MIKRVVKQHLRPQDIFLAEAINKGEEPSPRERAYLRLDYGVPMEMTAEGWDDKEAGDNSVKSAVEGNSLSESIYTQFRDESLIESIDRAKERAPKRRIFVSAGNLHVLTVGPQVMEKYKTAIVDASIPMDPLKSRRRLQELYKQVNKHQK